MLDAKRIAYTAKVYDAAASSTRPTKRPRCSVRRPRPCTRRSSSFARRPAGRGRCWSWSPSDRQIDLRLLAKSLGEKKLRMATQREAERSPDCRSAASPHSRSLNKPFDVAARRARAHARAHPRQRRPARHRPRAAYGGSRRVTGATFVRQRRRRRRIGAAHREGARHRPNASATDRGLTAGAAVPHAPRLNERWTEGQCYPRISTSAATATKSSAR